jgi:tRNA-Thr(GGU) m(6)t(6)A37 methyltransferase TsaA
MKTPSFRVSPIGMISTPYRSKYAAPRQPATSAAKTTGQITLFEGMNFEQALEDLSGFDHVWVVFWFHQNTSWKPKVLPPHGGRTKRGVFSTRSPHRPNPIGLSLCKLLEVRDRTLTIENPDMLDGTPILDIKPYIAHSEAIPDSRSGWIGQANEGTSRAYVVSYSSDFTAHGESIPLDERESVRRYVVETLSNDPLPHAYRRIKRRTDGSYQIAVKRWRFLYTITDSAVEIFGIAHDIEREDRT